jgi:MFS family permease
MDPSKSAPRSFELRGWLDPAVVALALMALASGFGQFGAVSALGDVARTFGHASRTASLAEQAGLSTTKIGIGLAILRFASLAGLPLAGVADRFGRRRMLLLACAFGLALTVLAAASPGYWWFVAIFALGRPWLSATNALSQVGAAEETASRDRAKAVALVAAGYGVGSGLTAVIHGLAGTIGFRGVFALALVPLMGLLFIRRWLVEPGRFVVAQAATEHPLPVLGAVGREFRARLLVVCALAFAVSVVTGPANSLVFLYAQNILRLSGVVTALMVVVAALFGLAGLLAGRWLADRFGRRPTAAAAMLAMALTGMLTYGGSRPAMLVGYELGILSASTFAPGAGSLLNELFPTSVRASVSGWNVAAGVIGAVVGLLEFGAIAGAGDHYARAAVITFLPVLATVALFFLLPETNRREPEDLWPDIP